MDNSAISSPPGGPEPSLDELRRELEALREAVRARDDFIAIAAHELRNPMTPVLGMTELALAAARRAPASCSPRVIALLERLQGAVQDYVKRATKLLDVSRIESGNVRLEPRPLDLSMLVGAVAQRHETLASRGGSALQVDLEADIKGILDPLAVEQIVENLISNALKFGIGRPVSLRLRSNGDAALLEVQDLGIGMGEDEQARVFGRFEQLVTHHRGSGFGVGLWVAGRLAQAMGGRIAIASRPQEGSTFTVIFPLAFSQSALEDN
jgi:two-component system, OmpR family, sensor kinase